MTERDVFKAGLVLGAQFGGNFEMPSLERVDFKPNAAIPFEKAYRRGKTQKWLHFYTHDRHFERVWNHPKRYLPMFGRFGGVISPDFSLFRELPLAVQIWNTYRGRAIASWLQRKGIDVVPNVRWSDERSYAFAFEGLPTEGSVAVSTHGCIGNGLDRHYFKKGLARMMKVLRPKTVINHGQTPEDIFGKYLDDGVEVIQIPYYYAATGKAVL